VRQHSNVRVIVASRWGSQKNQRRLLARPAMHALDRGGLKCEGARRVLQADIIGLRPIDGGGW
jgi:hypothetical protein